MKQQKLFATEMDAREVQSRPLFSRSAGARRGLTATRKHASCRLVSRTNREREGESATGPAKPVSTAGDGGGSSVLCWLVDCSPMAEMKEREIRAGC